MNHDAPRQIASTRLWHYTTATRNGTCAIGYCAAREACPDCKHLLLWSPEQRACKTCGGTGLVERTKPCAGHATAEEACEHHKQFVLDHQVRYYHGRPDPRQLNRCQAPGCRAMTDGHATVGSWSIFVLCPDHRNRETLDQLVTIGEAWHS